MGRRVVVTGLGVISPIGKNLTETWENAKKGVNGISDITSFSPEEAGLSVKFAGEIKDYNAEDFIDRKEAKRMDKFIQLAIISSNEAVKDSGLDVNNIDNDRLGVIYASGIGGLNTIAENVVKGENKNFSRLSPFFIPGAIINLGAGQVAIKHKANGTCTSIVTACASATDSIGQAYRTIKDNYQDVIITGGSEACIGKTGIGGFQVMRALNTSEDKNRASIPFDKERSGFVMGEGGGCLILEELEHAKSRGAKIYAEVVGYGTTCDANHITAPIEGGLGAAKCMEMALKDSNKDEVTYINAHGTSTPLNDKTETAAIKKVFGNDTKVSISSTKSMTGHLLGASGAIEAILTVKAIQDDFVPPTINYKVPDEECDLDITPNEGKAREMKIGISNSLGFGGHNSTVAFRKYGE